MVHRLTGSSQYAIGRTSLYPTNGFSAKGLYDKACFAWPPHSPDLTPWDFYMQEGCVYVRPLPADLSELRHRMEADVARITSDTLNKVWGELAYRLDVWRVKNGAHIEHL
ncbi:uncharacterized protein TNCV_26211 [Trichonephila clavipes]|uniref:Tc1-like transposase DDE domain-containing protein n=1 Tax=Trichonephila clavipes TaxID=2585209 RepID=A0A8X6W1K7_TRICX|nr:uncharacterized protein TNCV_26211 [Trichonephila clavipes]